MRRLIPVLHALPVTLAALTLLLTACDPARAAEERQQYREERLIGWLGEVPRPQRTAADADRDSSGGARDASSSSYAPPDLARFPEHDATDLDTDFIGVGNPKVEKLSDDPKAYLWRGFLSPSEAGGGEPSLAHAFQRLARVVKTPFVLGSPG